jgi:hypothetical protein
MKKSKSLFQAATEKYTSLHSDLAETKKAFLEGMSATDLNKLYAGSDKKAPSTPTTSTTSNTKSNPGGSENPNPASSPVGKDGSSANTDLQQVASFADALPVKLPNGDTILVNPTTGEIIVGSDTPGSVTVQSKQDVTELQNLAGNVKDILGKSMPTNEDIMSALTTLSTGEVMDTSHDIVGEDDGSLSTEVQPTGDVLVDEGDKDGLSTEQEASAEPMTSTSSDISSPSDSTSQASSANTGAPMSASSNMPTEETKDPVTGVDDSYVAEKDEDTKGKEETEEKAPEGNIGIEKDSTKGAGETPEVNSKAIGSAIDPQSQDSSKEFAKGAGEYHEPGKVGESSPALGEEAPEGEGSPSGKDSAFWVPGDDMLGLKDIVSTVAQKNGTPNAQETIGQDAAGNLVKKPTTPTHSIPNMRQYVRTNGVPGAPSVMGMGSGQPVNISDMGLDDLMGMDTATDKALNISLNFNF